jgi:hypothetical protein
MKEAVSGVVAAPQLDALQAGEIAPDVKPLAIPSIDDRLRIEPIGNARRSSG